MVKRIHLFLLPLMALLLVFGVVAQSSSWVGRYEFSENGGKTAGGTGIFIEHEIEISEGDSGLVAFIKSNGFQTSVDLVGTAKIVDGRLEIYFENYGEDNMFESYKSGDLLLSLERKTVRGKAVILTNWGKFTPSIERNNPTGKVYFKMAAKSEK